MRRGFGVIGLVMTAIVLVIVGVIAYNVGWSDGVSTHLPAGTAAAPPYYYGYGPHAFGWGFGIFGFFLFLFFVFCLFGLLRFALFGRRMWGGGWGYGHGGHGHGMPPAIDERMQEWHKRAHGEAPATPPPPPPDQRSV
ncbi:MAG TPA: hypothetical protein VMW11_05540 [Candidatus Dormibacteraeota bacterium]|nr:hypothetical protein [Candidatus Dormibacteraeota bacterium]